MELDEMLKKLMETIKVSVESNEIIGRPILCQDGSVVMPVSKMSYGFATGGGEYGDEKSSGKLPYAGVSGGGVTVTPLGFLVCGREKRFVSLDGDERDNKWTELLKAIINTVRK